MFRAVIAGLIAAILIGAEPATAMSVPDPVRSTQWTVTECAAGKLTGAFRQPQGGVIVTGSATECGKHVPGSIFAVATFHVRDPDRKPFAELEDARYFRKGESRLFGIRTFYGTGTEVVCLMATATKPIDCAMVTVPEIGVVTVVRLKTSDPRVSTAVELGRGDDPGNPSGSSKCGNCW